MLTTTDDAHRPYQPTRHIADLVAALLAGWAGALHLWLMPEHLAESLLFGAVFLGIAAFQLGIAAALLLAPGPVVRSIGRWGSFAVVATFLGTRIVPPPGGGGHPEPIAGPWGLLSLLLELGALAALAVLLPTRPGRRPGFPVWTAGAVGGTYFVLQLIASGGVVHTREPLAPAFLARLLTIEGGFPNQSPALSLVIAHHWSLYLPLASTALAGVVAVLLALAVGLTVQRSRVRTDCRTRIGLLGAVPASLSAPVCCGPSLLSAAGVGLAGLLGALAVPLLGLSAVLLLADIVWLRGQLRRAALTGEPAH